MNTWDVLAAKYFEETCIDILDGPMASMGYEYYRSWATRIIYRKGDLFVRFSHWVEDCPNYVVMIGVGIIEGIDGEESREGLGLGYIMPEDYDFNKWCFVDEESLEAALYTIASEILVQYVKPILEDRERLSRLIDEQAAELRTYDEKFITPEYEKARKAYKEKQYRKALEIYSRIELGELSDLDKKIFNYCHKKVTVSVKG